MKAVCENLERLGWRLNSLSRCSESHYYRVARTVTVRLSEHWGASKALPLLYGGEYGPLLQALTVAAELPVATKAQRRFKHAVLLDTKARIRRRSGQIWREWLRRDREKKNGS